MPLVPEKGEVLNETRTGSRTLDEGIGNEQGTISKDNSLMNRFFLIDYPSTPEPNASKPCINKHSQLSNSFTPPHVWPTLLSLTHFIALYCPAIFMAPAP